MELPALNDIILPGMTAFFLAFMAWREARKAKTEVMRSAPPVTSTSSSSTNPIVAGVSMAWDRDQQERLLQFVERIAKALEATHKENAKVAAAQEMLVDQHERDTQDKLDTLLARLDRIPFPNK